VIVGVPKEIKRDEYRVAMLPVGVEEMVRAGHQVLVEAGAGLGSGLPDHDYLTAGAELVSDAREIFRQAAMIVKVKEPQPGEWPMLRSEQLLFTFFHFAASRELTTAMIESGATCIAYETLEDKHGRLPLLMPMSEVAGRMSIQEGAKFLERPQMGRGILYQHAGRCGTHQYVCPVQCDTSLGAQDRESRRGTGGPTILPDRFGREHLPRSGCEPGRGGDVRTETLAASVLRATVLKGADER
jgi:alanine dehydrogenase